MKNDRLILILGSGNTKWKNAVTIDINSFYKPNIIHNLNKFPYPFKTNKFNKIIAHNIIEHLDDVIGVMEEIYRISKPNAIIEIVTAHFTSVDSFTDPTHKHFFTSRTFDYLIPGSDLYKYRYSKAKFKMISVHAGPQNNINIILKILLKLINNYLTFYESRLAYIFPVGTISYKLKVIK